MSASAPLIKVLLVDDHPIFRDGFIIMVKKLKPQIMEIVGEAGNGKELLEKAETLQPDIIFMDIQMPVMSGLEATIRLKERYPQMSVIALSTFNDPFIVGDMLKAGVDGYLLKNTNKEEVVAAITTVYNGGTYFTKDEKVQEAKKSYKKEKKKEIPRFSGREQEITQLISEEFSNKEVAHQLSLSVRSVETYKERIQSKVGAKNFIGVIVYAIKNRLIR